MNLKSILVSIKLVFMYKKWSLKCNEFFKSIQFQFEKSNEFSSSSWKYGISSGFPLEKYFKKQWIIISPSPSSLTFVSKNLSIEKKISF